MLIKKKKKKLKKMGIEGYKLEQTNDIYLAED